MSYSLSSNFVPVEWCLAELWPLNLYFFVQILSCPDFFILCPLRYWLDIWYVAISRWVTIYVRISFQSNDFWLSYGRYILGPLIFAPVGDNVLLCAILSEFLFFSEICNVVDFILQLCKLGLIVYTKKSFKNYPTETSWPIGI